MCKMFCLQKQLRRVLISLLFSFFAFSDLYGAGHFAYSDEWLALGHYQSDGKGYESTIDTENFFLSENGKVNPEDELKATILLFEGNDNELKCKFPARYMVLKKRKLITKDFPQCKDYEQYYDDLRPEGVTFIFTDAYMNNPSSLFGHTLLRVDTARKGTQLLAHGANYGAYIGENPSPLYPLLGLVGGYYGGFTIKPYFDIINTYNNIENRDIWEFELNFSSEEKDLLVAHLWELSGVQARYYFFGRNCSYMLMETLDAVRPELKMAQEFPLQTIPTDTVKKVYQAQGLVKKINYRPSRQNKIKYNYTLMNEQEQNATEQAIFKQNYNFENLSEKSQAKITETVYQYIQYQYVAENLDLRDYRKQSFMALRSRSKLKTKIDEDELQGQYPFLAHGSMRATFGAGVRNGEGFQELSYRPAYHSLTDNNYGFLRGAEINFLNTTLRHYDDDDKYVLEKFELLGIRSVSPINKLFKPISFQILVNINRENNFDNQKNGYVANFVVGGGGTYALNNNIWLFAMMNNHLAYGGFLPRNQWGGVGGQIGILIDAGNLRTLVEAEKVFASSKIGAKTVYKAEIAYSLNRDWAWEGRYKYQQNYGKDIDEMYLGIRSYF